MITERWGRCPYCSAKGEVVCEKKDGTSQRVDCIACDGTGFAKDGQSYQRMGWQDDWARGERPEDSKWSWIGGVS